GSPEQVLGRKPFEIPSLDAEDAAAGLMNIMGDKISATALGHLLSLKEEDAAAGREIYPGGMPPGLASIAQPPPRPKSGKELAEAWPSLAALAVTLAIPESKLTALLGPSFTRIGVTNPFVKRLLMAGGRTAAAGAVGASARAGVEIERHL